MAELVDFGPGADPDHVQVLEASELFERFYRREYRPVLALAFVLSGNASLAEEVAQEAFTEAFHKWDGIENPEGWVRTVVSNKVHSWRRRRYAEIRALARLGRGIPTAIEQMPAESDHFWAEVRHLPRRQAQVIALFYLEDRPAGDVAEILGISESAVREHLMRGRNTLAARTGEES